MFDSNPNSAISKTTSYKVVLPFYIYAGISFLVASLFLFAYSEVFLNHYYQPKILAITHIMALGWATMLILGASHQLVPVFIEGRLYSDKLAYLSFLLLAVGVPVLVYGFYTFDMNIPAKLGGIFVVFAVLTFLINLAVSIIKSNRDNIHAMFVITATFWLFYTVLLGLILVYNFNTDLLPDHSLHFLSLHAHSGILGWFLLLIIGVASRLIPMFLISKYTNDRLLWWIYSLINVALILYQCIFIFFDNGLSLFIPVIMILIAIFLFVFYCIRAFQNRMRNKLDEQMKISLISVAMMLFLILLFIIIISMLCFSEVKPSLVLTYGFLIFFGWLSSLMLGMTFKTLPFIVWNKVYHHRAAFGNTPSPKELFEHTIFKIMCIIYLIGFSIFAIGIILASPYLLKIGAFLIIITSILYNINVFKIILHKASST
jgi:hypothetical protein